MRKGVYELHIAPGHPRPEIMDWLIVGKCLGHIFTGEKRCWALHYSSSGGEFSLIDNQETRHI